MDWNKIWNRRIEHEWLIFFGVALTCLSGLSLMEIISNDMAYIVLFLNDVGVGSLCLGLSIFLDRKKRMK